MVLADSHRISPMILGITAGRPTPFTYGTITPYGPAFQLGSVEDRFSYSLTAPTVRRAGPTTPLRQRCRAITPYRFRLFPFRSPLLGESRLLSFPRGTEMFQFPRLPLPALCVQTGVAGHYPGWVSPFGYPRISACLTAPRGLSQPAASFIGS